MKKTIKIHLNHDGQLLWCSEYSKPVLQQLWED